MTRLAKSDVVYGQQRRKVQGVHVCQSDDTNDVRRELREVGG